MQSARVDDQYFALLTSMASNGAGSNISSMHDWRRTVVSWPLLQVSKRYSSNVAPPTETTTVQAPSKTVEKAASGAAAGSRAWRILQWTGSNKLSQFFIAVLRDYRSVGVDTLKSMRRRPLKASIYIGSCAGLFALNVAAPDEISFHHFLRLYANDIALVGSAIRSPDADNHISRLRQLDINDQLRYQKVGLFSVVWRDDFAARVDLFDKNCNYLKQPDWLHPVRFLRERIEDFGICRHWLMLDRCMRDYDVNSNEVFPPPKPPPVDNSTWKKRLWSRFKRVTRPPGWLREWLREIHPPLVKPQSQFEGLIPSQDFRWDNPYREVYSEPWTEYPITRNEDEFFC